MHVDDPVMAEFDTHLANRLQKRQRLDITHRATNLDETDIGIAGALFDAFNDLIGDVRDDLHRRTEIIAAALLGDDAFVNPACRVVAVASAFRGTYETLVVPEVKVGLCAIAGHKNLTVLERTHRTRIHIDVRIQLDHADRKSACLKDRAKTSRRDAFPEGRNHAAGDENIRCHV